MIDELTLKKIRQTYNDEAIFLLSAFPEKDIETVSTGSLLLDDALGGGIPLGRYTEVYGPDSSGKTTICQHIIANAQRDGLDTVFIDVENALDPEYAVACGVDFEDMYLSQPGFAEEALGIAEMIIKESEGGVIIIDSVASLSPEAEGEDEFEDKNVTGMHRAKLLNTFFRRTAKIARKNNVAVVLTNQMRDNTQSRWGGLKTVGGHGIKHYASIRLSLWKGRTIEQDDREIGLHVDATVRKNKVAAPFGKAEFSILASYGIDKAANLFTTGKELGVIQQRGSYYKFDGDTISQGEANTIEVMREDLELLETIESECREILDV